MLVIVEDGGGLANRLFVFANVIATALETGHRVANPSFRRWAESFEGTRGDSLSFFPRRGRPTLGGPGPARVAASLSYRITKLLKRTVSLGPLRAITLQWPEQCDLDNKETAEDLRLRRLVFLKGWLFRNPSGVIDHQTKLRNFFKPVYAIRAQTERVTNIARSKGDLLVGVHVRQGDYQAFMGGKFFYPFSTYLHLMRQVSSLFEPRRATFLVCSDQIHATNESQEIPVTFSRMNPVQDLWGLSQCDLIMGPPSTFSTWAAFLGRTPLWEVDNPTYAPHVDSFCVPIPVPRGP